VPAYPPSNPFLPSALEVTPEASVEQALVAKTQQRSTTNGQMSQAMMASVSTTDTTKTTVSPFMTLNHVSLTSLI